MKYKMVVDLERKELREVLVTYMQEANPSAVMALVQEAAAVSAVEFKGPEDRIFATIFSEWLMVKRKQWAAYEDEYYGGEDKRALARPVP